MSTQYYEGIGRRKEASARVRLFPGGNGAVIINDKPGDAYLSRAGDLDAILAPLRTAGLEGSYNVTVHVTGGVVTGQTSAIQLGVARAVLKVDPELRPALRHGGFLTRDARVK